MKRFGIIGGGTWGERHCQALSAMQNEGVELWGLCEINQSRAKTLAERYKIPNIFSDYREMLKEPSLVAVSIALPDHLHKDAAIAAAESGKDILIEKPLALTVEDAQAILDVTKKNGVRIMVDFHGRWNPNLNLAKKAITEQRLGKVRQVAFRLSNRITVPLNMLSWAGQSGVLGFLGSHAIDLVRWFIGDSPNRVYAVSRSELLVSKGISTPDFYLVIMEFPNGQVATLEHLWILPETEPSIKDYKVQIVGDKGIIKLDLSHHRSLEIIAEDGISLPEMFAAPQIYGEHKGFTLESIAHFARCVVNEEEFLVTGEDGLEVTRIMEAIEESIKTGVPVSLA